MAKGQRKEKAVRIQQSVTCTREQIRQVVAKAFSDHVELMRRNYRQLEPELDDVDRRILELLMSGRSISDIGEHLRMFPVEFMPTILRLMWI